METMVLSGNSFPGVLTYKMYTIIGKLNYTLGPRLLSHHSFGIFLSVLGSICIGNLIEQ